MGVKDTIPYRQVRTGFAGADDEISEWMSIDIPTKNKEKLRITNVYIPPANSRTEQGKVRKIIVTTDKWSTKTFDCFLGDFNAYSATWSEHQPAGNTSTARGETIDKWLEETDMVCINDASKSTRTNRTTHSDSSPDLSIVNAALLDKFTWKVEDRLGSDHKPIILTFEASQTIPKVNDKPKYKWNLKKADWQSYTEFVENNLTDEDDTISAQALEQALEETITKAANKFVKKKKINNRTKPMLTPEIKDAIKVREEARKNRSKDKKKWNEACHKVKSMIEEEKRKAWKEYVDQIDMKTKPQEVWRTIRSMEGKQAPQRKNEVLVTDGVARIDDKDKAEAFAKTYKGFSRLPKGKKDLTMKRKVRNWIKDKPPHTEWAERDISLKEMESVINQAGLNKSAGVDDIPYELIKHLGPRARTRLLKIFNLVWKGEQLPSNWRTANIITLLKDGKNPEITTSYRPISLTSCMGKILEKIIADRMTYILEDKGLLTNNQAGFRQGRCTTDQILKLTQRATDQIQNRSTDKEYATMVTFFDYEKAYDKVWRAGLLHKLQELNMPWRYVRYVRNFLSGRITTVEVNGTKSRKFHLNEGLPQGSAISPLLFLTFINDIDTDLEPDTIACLFADDTSVAVQGGKDIIENTRKQMQKEVNKILEWARTWKMSINTDKTKALISSSKADDLKVDPKIGTRKGTIGTVNQYKFLGVTIDGGLRFNDHIEHLVRKCKQRVRILKSMASKDWGNPLEVQRTLFVQFVRPVLEYASSSFAPWISTTNMKRLDAIQNEALRTIAGLAQTCPKEFLRLETDIDPLNLRFAKNDLILWDKYKRLPDTDERHRMASNSTTPRLTTRFGWSHQTQKRARELGLDTITRETTTPPIPPWETFDNLSIRYVELEKKKSEYKPQELRRMSLEQIEAIDTDLTVYTDGSTSGNQEKGGAGIYIHDRNGETITTMCEPAGTYCSSYSGECMALLHTLKWIARSEIEWKEGKSILICTDSRSLTDALKQGNWKDTDHWLRESKRTLIGIKSQITLMWIPSHVDIPGNEKADELASIGTTMDQEGIPVSHKIIKAKIKRQGWSITHERARKIYKHRRSPINDVEKKWPRRVRTLFARLRSGHAMQLKAYRHFIELEDDALCEEGCGKEETLEHMLCECVATEAARQRLWDGQVEICMMIDQPETCRKILMTRINELSIEPAKTHTNDDPHDVGCH